MGLIALLELLLDDMQTGSSEPAQVRRVRR